MRLWLGMQDSQKDRCQRLSGSLNLRCWRTATVAGIGLLVEPDSSTPGTVAVLALTKNCLKSVPACTLGMGTNRNIPHPPRIPGFNQDSVRLSSSYAKSDVRRRQTHLC